jgi:hypothetical protein
MNSEEAWAEARRILGAPVVDLSGGRGTLGVIPLEIAREWSLPEDDSLVLRRYGLPPVRSDGLVGVSGVFQTVAEPTITNDGIRLYVLGRFGSATLAAVEGSGAVAAIPAYTQVHPQLASIHPAGISSVVVNSGVVELVDLAWRWHWLVPILADQQIEASKGESAAVEVMRATGELPDVFADVRALCAEVLAKFRSVDPMAVDGEYSFWNETVMDGVPIS